MKSKIAGYKIDKLANLLTDKLSVQIKGLETQMSEEAKKVFLKYLPGTVREAWKEYPDALKTLRSFRLNAPEGDSYLLVDLAMPGIFMNPQTNERLYPSDILGFEPTLYEFLIAVWKQIVELKLKRSQMRNQIKCVVSKLGTYAKLRKEFPEAYKVLVEKIDGEEVEKPKESMCDSVEKLRAELNQKGGDKCTQG